MLGAGGRPALNLKTTMPLCRCKKANQFRVALAELETYFKVCLMAVCRGH